MLLRNTDTIILLLLIIQIAGHYDKKSKAPQIVEPILTNPSINKTK